MNRAIILSAWTVVAIGTGDILLAQGVPASDPAAAEPARQLPHPAGEKVVVSIEEFRSDVLEIPARGTTDMFITALLQSGQFRVVERARLDSIAREKQLNAAGASDGDSAQNRLRAAQYLFEGAITEAHPNEAQRSGGISVAGMALGGGTNRDVIGIDVRIVEVSSGDVVDVISLRKPIKSDAAAVSGIGNLLGTIRAQQGKSTTYTPDVSAQQQRAQSVDVALRDLITQAVDQLKARFR